MLAILLTKPRVQASLQDESAGSCHHSQAPGHKASVIHQIHNLGSWLLRVNLLKHAAHVFHAVICKAQLESQELGSHIQVMAAKNINHKC